MFKRIAQTEIFLQLCPFFAEDQRMYGEEFVTLLYFLTLFDHSVSIYANESKNPFIDQFYEEIDKKQYYNLEIYNRDEDSLEVSDEDEIKHDENESQEEKEKKAFFVKTEKVILENLQKTYDIYGKHLSGKRQERYLIEVLYYHFFINKKITKSFVRQNAESFGDYINDKIQESQNLPNPPGQDFNLVDAYRDKVAHTVRVNFRFSELGKIIDNYFNQVN